MVDEKKMWKNWLVQAEEDLDVAEYSLKGEKYYASVFWCQQAIEKGLKALWIKEKKELKRVHDLVILGKEVGLPESFFDMLDGLTDEYTISRYDMSVSIPSEKYSKEDADNFIKLARDILKWVKKKI